MNNFAATLDSLGRHEEALTLMSQTLAVRRRVLGAKHPNTITGLKNLAALHGNRAEWDECHGLYRELMELFRADLDDAQLAVTAAFLAGETNWARECLSVLQKELASLPDPRAGRLLACCALATPEVTTNLEPVFQAAEVAFKAEPTAPINILFQGEADYRRGRWAEARLRWDPVRQAMITAFQFAGQQKWGEARDAWLKAMAEPGFAWDTALEFENDLAFKMGMTFLRTNDRTNHTQLCRTLLAQARETHNPTTRFSTALIALLDGDANDLRQPATDTIAAASQENADPGLAPGLALPRDWRTTGAVTMPGRSRP